MSTGQYPLLLDALAALRNGIVYGVKIRAPHTLVLQCVWSKGTWTQTFEKVRELSIQHGMNLGLAALVFKIGTALLQMAQGEARPWHRALLGGLCGFIFWGEANPVNVQVNMYVMSRVMAALLALFIERRIAAGKATPLSSTEQALYGAQGYRLLSMSIWAAALYLFFNHGHVLQSGLRQSMQFIYKDGDAHEGDIKNVVWGNPQPPEQREVEPASPMLPVEAIAE